jgi:hypothetical protein
MAFKFVFYILILFCEYWGRFSLPLFILFGGASNYGGGTLDNVAGRVGFVFKIGKITPTSNQAISQKAQKLESQLSEVKQENQKIISENQKLTGYLEEIKNLIATHNGRLANLEKVAKLSGDQRITAQFNKKASGLDIANASE